MKPVYIKKAQYDELLGFLNNPGISSLNDLPNSLAREAEELKKYKIITTSRDEDEKILQFVRSRIPSPSINVCYFILTEQCNLACKYCFLGNNVPEKRKKFLQNKMSKEIASKALSFFVRQIRLSGNSSPENKPTIIFYGGEPLLNFDVLEFISLRVNEMKLSDSSLKNTELSVVTNGVLLDKAKLQKLKELGVSIAISIDGCSEDANEHRVDITGRSTFHRVIQALDAAKELSVDVSLSVTLTEKTIEDKERIIDLISRYNIKGFGFNILMSDDSFSLDDKYNDDAASFIIDVFKILRKKGVYEDRIMRKLNAFSKSQVYFSDCAATAGSQIVITPDGGVGICHGCLADREFFITTIENDEFNANENSMFLEWSQLTPVNKEECLDCEALGICGGGCPINARNSKEENSIYSLDCPEMVIT